MIKDYIGIPFKTLDCYALVREIYKNEHGIILPDPKIRFDETQKIYHKFAYEISKNWERCACQSGTVVALRYNPYHPKLVTHFGYVVDKHKFIHTLEETGAILDNLKNYTTRIEGFYKWKQA